MFSVYRTASWTPSSGIFDKVLFDTAEYDISSNVDLVTNKGRFTAPINGVYSFKASVSSSGVNNGATIAVTLFKNGTEAKRLSAIDRIYSNSGTVGPTVSGSADMKLKTGDYVEVNYLGNLGTGGVGAAQTFFSGHLVSK